MWFVEEGYFPPALYIASDSEFVRDTAKTH